MAQKTRQSLFAVAMRLYGSFAGKIQTTSALAALKYPAIVAPRLRDQEITVPTLASRSILAPRLRDVEILP